MFIVLAESTEPRCRQADSTPVHGPLGAWAIRWRLRAELAMKSLIRGSGHPRGWSQNVPYGPAHRDRPRNPNTYHIGPITVWEKMWENLTLWAIWSHNSFDNGLLRLPLPLPPQLLLYISGRFAFKPNRDWICEATLSNHLPTSDGMPPYPTRRSGETRKGRGLERARRPLGKYAYRPRPAQRIRQPQPMVVPL